MATTQLSWSPSAEASKRSMFYIGVLLAVIGAIAFGISFDSVMIAARPVFGDAAWCIPILLDATLAALTAAGLILELNGLRARLPQYFARVLIALTVFANVEPAHGLFPRIMHGAPPVTWAVLVLIAERTVRKLASLTDENRIEGIRRSLWLLRPVATLRIWRRMRVEALHTYLEGLDRDAARAAIVGRLRLHYGRFWKWNAPLAERIALRLDGRDPAGIGEVLRTHTDTAAMLAGTYLETEQQSAEQDTTRDSGAVPSPVGWARARGPVSGRKGPRGASRRLRQARDRQSTKRAAEQHTNAPEASRNEATDVPRPTLSQAPRKPVNVPVAAAALAAQHPDMRADTIADILGVHKRTVQRHLSSRTPELQHANGATV